MAHPSVLLIGLDAADPGLLLEWMQSGVMPNLAKIRDRGVWGRLETAEGLGDDAAWASFSTACGPEKHGRFFHRQPVAGSYQSRSFREGDTELEPFWAQLSKLGERVAVLDVPKSPLVQRLNGAQLSDWRVHGRDGPTRSWPADLANRVLAAFGDDDTDKPPDYLCATEGLPKEQLANFVERLLTSVDRKLSASVEVLAQDHWDLFLVVFKEAHCVGHQCWHLVDEQHPEFDELLVRELNHPVQSVYAALDRAVGELLKLAGDDTTVVVFSPLGMRENLTGEHLMESILLRLEPARLFSLWQRIYSGSLETRLPKIKKLLDAAHKRLMSSRTAIHVKHNELSGAVRLNLAGREPHGKVAPDQKETTIKRLEEELLKLVDADSGAPIVSRVLRTDEVFAGPRSDSLGDLLVEWSRDARFKSVSSPTIGSLRTTLPSWRSGNHVPGGVFFACGPSIDVLPESVGASIVDIGPTVASLLGHELSNVDGCAIPAVVTIE